VDRVERHGAFQVGESERDKNASKKPWFCDDRGRFRPRRSDGSAPGEGASILLLDRNIAAAQDLCDELGDRSIAVRADVTSAADVESAMDGAIWMAPK
jgi:hypothetical protein